MLIARSSTPRERREIATANTTSINTITTTFDTDIVKKCQCTVFAGWFKLTIAAIMRAPGEAVVFIRYGARYLAAILLGGDHVGVSVICELTRARR